MAKHVLVIFNPTAKSQVQTEEWIGKLIEHLNTKDEYLVSFYSTTSELTPENLVPFIRPPLDLIIAAGGDGTVRFTLAALASVKSEIPVAILPLGTGNVLARNLGVMDAGFFANPFEYAFDYIVNGQVKKIDLGMMNGEYFSCMAGVGPLSDAIAQTHRKEKTKLRLFAYIKAYAATIAKPSYTFKVTTGGKTYKVQASGIFIGNVNDLGIGTDVDSDALFNGHLDLHIINPTNLVEYVELGRQFAVGAPSGRSPELVRRVKEATIELIPRRGVRSAFQVACAKFFSLFGGQKHDSYEPRNEQLPCMVDGEEFGTTPMRITVIPQAVNVLVYNSNKGKEEGNRESVISRIAPLFLVTWFTQIWRSLPSHR